MKNKRDRLLRKRLNDRRWKFLQQVLKMSPDYIEALEMMGDLCTRSGALEEGFAIDRHLAFLQPFEPYHYYNLACDCALLGKKEKALLYLKISIILGYNDFKHLTEDPDLENLRGDARYDKLVRQISGGRIK
ncbi:MAG: hypothetical protein NC907_02425 [Candidatus Omnitrophica bacterium]|nr:hypothetical protein [Candidatus Omnitrophota bacterium]